MKRILSLLAIAAALAAAPVSAHDAAAHANAPHQPHGVDATAFGRPGDPASFTRTVNVTMSDTMRFSPSSVRVRKGETIRFLLHNRGAMLHEMVLGTGEALRRHATQMRNGTAMEHAQAYIVHVKPGASGQLVWTFDQAGRFEFACLIPGHFEAGMKGQVEVQ
jgi:uncharacterized cupredoxin-like copper-binding protein